MVIPHLRGENLPAVGSHDQQPRRGNNFTDTGQGQLQLGAEGSQGGGGGRRGAPEEFIILAAGQGEIEQARLGRQRSAKG